MDVCDSYAEHDEGLGLGNFPLASAPLPHPFCTCIWFVDTSKTLGQVAKELGRWEQGESNEALDRAFGMWQERNEFANHNNRGIINMSERAMADGKRMSASYVLDDDDIAEVRREIRAVGAKESVFRFNIGRQTGYLDDADAILVHGDIFPDVDSLHPRDQMSVRAVIAHEYYGHRSFRGTIVPKGAWNDEFRASYRAAIDAPNLSDNDRRLLILDAIERAKEANVIIKPNEMMRRLLYGYK